MYGSNFWIVTWSPRILTVGQVMLRWYLYLVMRQHHRLRKYISSCFTPPFVYFVLMKSNTPRRICVQIFTIQQGFGLLLNKVKTIKSAPSVDNIYRRSAYTLVHVLLRSPVKIGIVSDAWSQVIIPEFHPRLPLPLRLLRQGQAHLHRGWFQARRLGQKIYFNLDNVLFFLVILIIVIFFVVID